MTTLEGHLAPISVTSTLLPSFPNMIIPPVEPRDQKRQLQRLLLIQPRITVRRVVQTEIVFCQSARSAHALRHRFTCQF